MIDFSPPAHVEQTVLDMHRFIEDDMAPIEHSLADYLTKERLYPREDGRLAPEVLAAQQTIRKRSAQRGVMAAYAQRSRRRVEPDGYVFCARGGPSARYWGRAVDVVLDRRP